MTHYFLLTEYSVLNRKQVNKMSHYISNIFHLSILVALSAVMGSMKTDDKRATKRRQLTDWLRGTQNAA